MSSWTITFTIDAMRDEAHGVFMKLVRLLDESSTPATTGHLVRTDASPGHGLTIDDDLEA